MAHLLDQDLHLLEVSHEEFLHHSSPLHDCYVATLDQGFHQHLLVVLASHL